MIRIRWASVSRRSWSVHFFASRTLFSCSPYGTGRATKHALNAGERLFQRRAVGQFCSKPALNMWYGSRQPPAGQVGYSIMLVRYAVLERPLFAHSRRLVKRTLRIAAVDVVIHGNPPYLPSEMRPRSNKPTNVAALVSQITRGKSPVRGM